MRYLLQKSNERPYWWTLTDKDNGLVCRFEEGKFNDTQKFTFLDDVPAPDPNAIARMVREMSEWLQANHYELIFTSPQRIKEKARRDIGAQIKTARINAGMTVRDLTELTGIAYNHISRIEQGRYNVTLDILAVLADALDIVLEV